MQEPLILVEGSVVERARVDPYVRIFFKIEEGRECEWWINDERIKSNDEHFRGLPILYFKSGKNKCIISTAQEPIVSTAIDIIIHSGKCTISWCMTEPKSCIHCRGWLIWLPKCCLTMPNFMYCI